MVKFITRISCSESENAFFLWDVIGLWEVFSFCWYCFRKRFASGTAELFLYGMSLLMSFLCLLCVESKKFISFAFWCQVILGLLVLFSLNLKSKFSLYSRSVQFGRHYWQKCVYINEVENIQFKKTKTE